MGNKGSYTAHKTVITYWEPGAITAMTILKIVPPPYTHTVTHCLLRHNYNVYRILSSNRFVFVEISMAFPTRTFELESKFTDLSRQSTIDLFVMVTVVGLHFFYHQRLIILSVIFSGSCVAILYEIVALVPLFDVSSSGWIRTINTGRSGRVSSWSICAAGYCVTAPLSLNPVAGADPVA